jgi:hypothetical protein
MDSLSSTVVLIRKDWRIEINTEMWAEILLYLSKRGWQPSIPTHSFLAHNLNVSSDDASSFSVVGQEVLDQALREPLTVYPVPFDMGKLAEIIYFCEEGPFQICR